jgi:hypothetical protein
MADQLATKDDLAALLQQAVPDATATLLVEIATGLVQSMAGQRLVLVTDDTVQLDAPFDRYLLLPERPVVSVSAVAIDASPIADWIQIRNRLWRRRGWHMPRWTWPTPPAQVHVTYTHGFQPGDQRLQLARLAVLSLASGVASNPSGATMVRIDDYSAAYDAMRARADASPFLADSLRRQYGRPVGSAQLRSAGERQ